MINNAHLDLTLNEIEARQGSRCDDRCTRFMLACLLPIKDQLPPLAAQALELAQIYSAGSISAADVVGVREECWRQLSGCEMETDDPLVCAFRAVICVLYSREESRRDSLAEVLSFFLALVNRIEPRFDQQSRLLLEYFA